MNDRYYQQPTRLIGQGDILTAVPSLRIIRSDLEFVRRRQTARGPVGDLYTVDGARQPQGRAFDPNQDEVVAACQVGYAMILGNACDWDNSPTAPVPLALVRPLRTLPQDAHPAIRQGENGRFLHLPANDEPAFEESYVDFARATTVRASVLPSFIRLLSPSSELLAALYAALAYFYSRMDLAVHDLAQRAEAALMQAQGDNPA